MFALKFLCLFSFFLPLVAPATSFLIFCIKMVKCKTKGGSRTKMVGDKMVRTKWYGENSTDRIIN